MMGVGGGRRAARDKHRFFQLAYMDSCDRAESLLSPFGKSGTSNLVLTFL